MTLNEIVDLAVQERNVQRMNQNAKRQAEQSKVAKARLKMQKSQQKVSKARQKLLKDQQQLNLATQSDHQTS